MAEFQEAQVGEIVEACQTQTDSITGCLNMCLESDFQLEVGEQGTLSLDSIPPELDGPGMAVVFKIGDHNIVCLISESISLPDWYRTADETQASRMQTLGMEWSMCMLPKTMECSSFETITPTNLRTFLEQGDPVEGAFTLKLNIKQDGESAKDETAKADEEEAEAADESTTEESAELASESGPFLWVVGPLNHILKEETSSEEPVAETSADETESASAAESNVLESMDEPDFEEQEASAEEERVPSGGKTFATDEGINRFRKMSVNISVRLATKKIELGEFLSITPGTLITFDKSCDEPLELFVNNYRYCQGEAVKIGEKFGLKVDEVGIVDVRKDRIL